MKIKAKINKGEEHSIEVCSCGWFSSTDLGSPMSIQKIIVREHVVFSVSSRIKGQTHLDSCHSFGWCTRQKFIRICHFFFEKYSGRVLQIKTIWLLTTNSAYFLIVAFRSWTIFDLNHSHLNLWSSCCSHNSPSDFFGQCKRKRVQQNKEHPGWIGLIRHVSVEALVPNMYFCSNR